MDIFYFLHFYVFQSISGRLRHTFFFENFRECKAQNARKRSEQDASAKMLRQTVTLATAIFLYSYLSKKLFKGSICLCFVEFKWITDFILNQCMYASCLWIDLISVYLIFTESKEKWPFTHLSWFYRAVCWVYWQWLYFGYLLNLLQSFR